MEIQNEDIADKKDVIEKNNILSKEKIISNKNKIIKHINPPNLNINDIKIAKHNVQSGSFTLNEVASHNTRSDCYLIINNKVYDVSSYIGYHPGGSRIIISYCGREVTGIFASIHSNRAWDLLKKYKIGTISSLNTQDSTSQILTALYEALKNANPDAEIISVRPKNGFYVAKIIYAGNFYEVHIGDSGEILKEEVGEDEFNWLSWDSDIDDK